MFNYDKLATAIEASGKTKTYLCKKLNRPQYYLRDVIRQKNRIPDALQAILAEELGVSVDYLNDREEDQQKEPAISDGLWTGNKEAVLAALDKIEERDLLELQARITDILLQRRA